MSPSNRSRLLEAVQRWRLDETQRGYQSAADDRLVAEVDAIIRSELAQMPRDAAHAALDRGINALLDRVLPKPKKGRTS